MKGFHESDFDEATKLKLDLFRGYIRKWIPVFLTQWKSGKNRTRVNLFDFFAGPGSDASGNPGSPRILQQELRGYCDTHRDLRANGVEITLHYNDVNATYIKDLQRLLQTHECDEGCCRMEFSSLAFVDSLKEKLPVMKKPGSANLVIMDQFGVKDVTPEVVNTLAACPTTDILFFISSSYVRRFAETPEMKRWFGKATEQISAEDYRKAHRAVLDYFRSQLAPGLAFHLAPFSILKKGANIYGVIFGSRDLLGLEKFLQVCWGLDQDTGEANFNIEDDPAWRWTGLPFLEYNVTQKQAEFAEDLRHLLRQPNTSNLDVYRFTLEKGFLAKHAVSVLKNLQRAGELDVQSTSGVAVRRGAFYLSDDEWKKRTPRVFFLLRN